MGTPKGSMEAFALMREQLKREREIKSELLKALEAVLPGLAHKAPCGFVRPTEEWAEHGSWSWANCSCEISIARAAIAKATQ